MPFQIVKNDLTKMSVDAIVNAANTALKNGGGVCGAIFKASGEEALQNACETIGSCAVGEVVITPGFNLLAKYIIHTPGPIWQGGLHNEAQLLKNCYTNALKLAADYHLKSIAFPLISSGIYGYPKDQALEVAVLAIRSYLETHEMMVYLVVFED